MQGFYLRLNIIRQHRIKSIVFILSYQIALVALNSLYTLKKAMIITYEDEGEIERDGLRIEITPSWKWVLNEGHSDTNRQYIYY